MCGLPGAGKTTVARQVESATGAVRLSPDEWMVALGNDLWDRQARVRIEALQWTLATDLLSRGLSVILEHGFWSRAERDEARRRGREVGAEVCLRFLDAPVEELWARLEARNAAPETTVVIPRPVLELWEREQFEPPTPDELAAFDAESSERPHHDRRMPDVDQVDVILANRDRVTLRAGDVFLKIDADQRRTDVEVEAMAMAPVPTPEVLWRQPPALALGAVRGRPLGRMEEPSTASPAAWRAAGAAIRMLHDAPLPPWPGKSVNELASRLAYECEWLVANEVLPTEVVGRNRGLAEAVLRPWAPVFTHGDLHIEHVFIEGDEITGIIDWSEASQGDALFDLATITLAQDEHLDDVVAGYGSDVDRDLIRAWQSWRCLVAVRWLMENGYGPAEKYPEVAVLRSRA
ncbi:MAG TPA: AAA family ATPase [Acidimicrobiales bacterium]|nr:AAA family ATPase [Acidimicrobiales bacterium]